MLDFIRSALPYLVVAPILLTVVVTIHELGHFLIAKSFGTAIDRFSIGFGKAIASWTDKSGVQWRIGWIPLGGYVRFSGDSNDASLPDSDDLESLRAQIEEKLGKDQVARFFHFKPLWQRALVVFGGPFANFVLAVALFTFVFAAFGMQISAPQILKVVPDSPAAAAGLAPGDVLVAANGRALRSFEHLASVVAMNAETPIRFEIMRDGKRVFLTATPRRAEITNPLTKTTSRGGSLGVEGAGHRQIIRHTVPEAFGEAVYQVGDILRTTLTYIGRILTGRENGDQLNGIIGIAHVSGAVAKASVEGTTSPGEAALQVFGNLVSLTAALSVGIGFVNLLPIPVLDGGHLAFYAYEAVARRPVAAQVQAASYRVGLALVLGLMLFATWNDLQRLQAIQFIGGLFS